MKIRNDFVSNSSSSSFIVAVNKEYDITSFAKDAAKNSVNPKSVFHNKNLKHLNEVNVEYCLNNFVLAFLGTMTYDTEERIWTKEEFESKFDAYPDAWDNMLRDIEDAKKDTADEWAKRHYGRNFIDDEGKLHQFVDHHTYMPVVDVDTMQDEFRRSSWIDEKAYETESPDEFNIRIERLMKFARHCDECSRFIVRSEVYQITMDTIRNTRDLLKSGAKISFESWEDLDAIENRLKEGQRIFGLRINYQGDGYSNYAIYTENEDKDCLDGMAVEYIGSLD